MMSTQAEQAHAAEHGEWPGDKSWIATYAAPSSGKKDEAREYTCARFFEAATEADAGAHAAGLADAGEELVAVIPDDGWEVEADG